MSSNQKLEKLRQQLERWKSHNEVHEKPADKMLYEFLSELLNTAESNEQSEPSLYEVDQPPLVNPNQQAGANEEESHEGGNNPETPPDLP